MSLFRCMIASRNREQNCICNQIKDTVSIRRINCANTIHFNTAVSNGAVVTIGSGFVGVGSRGSNRRGLEKWCHCN
eukprot:5055657-Ditylum_brightwellii.AAC.1